MEEVGSGIVKGLAITLVGILGLTVLGGFKTSADTSAYAVMTGGQGIEVILAGIVLVGVITSIMYYFARE